MLPCSCDPWFVLAIEHFANGVLLCLKMALECPYSQPYAIVHLTSFSLKSTAYRIKPLAWWQIAKLIGRFFGSYNQQLWGVRKTKQSFLWADLTGFESEFFAGEYPEAMTPVSSALDTIGMGSMPLGLGCICVVSFVCATRACLVGAAMVATPRSPKKGVRACFDVLRRREARRTLETSMSIVMTEEIGRWRVEWNQKWEVMKDGLKRGRGDFAWAELYNF